MSIFKNIIKIRNNFSHNFLRNLSKTNDLDRNDQTPCEKLNKFQNFPVKSQVKREKTPIGKLDELEEGKHPDQLKEEYAPFPNATNPETGEIGGPIGPEPTRYGDWERKGRVSDF